MKPRLSSVRTTVFGIIATVATAACAAFSAIAADDDVSGAFLTAFPEGDVYQLTVMGDGFADGVLAGLVEAFGQDGRVNIQRSVRSIPNAMTSEFEVKAFDLEQQLAAEPVNIAVVMVGEGDRVSLRSSSGRRVQPGTPEWLSEYTRRIDRLMKIVKRKNAGVYWVGLPILARFEANDLAQKMNEVLRERAYLNGFKYIDAYTGFADEGGAYSAYGPDLEGKIRVLRSGDGVGFTEAGNRKLAHFVEKDLRRDLNQAKSNRTIPLLGSEDEQAKVNPDNANKQPPPNSPAAAASGAAPPVVKAKPVDSAALPAADGDQKADNGVIALKVTREGGRQETENVQIVRPAIPASVVALMARRDGSSQLGDLIVEQISGGLTLMSSVTSSGGRSRGKLSPTQAPYFRLLVKGERLTPKPGRADDTSWPPPGNNSSSSAPSAAVPPRG